MIGVKGYEPQEIAFPESDRAYSLAESQRIDLPTAPNLEMFDRFPLKACVAVQRIPIEIPQSTECIHDLFEIVSAQANQHVLKLRTVEIQADAVLSRGHVCVRLVPPGS